MEICSNRFYPWLSWALPSLGFLVMYVARVAPAAFLSDLIHDFHTDVGGIGILASAFLQGYVLMQIPVGLLVDRFGPVRLLFLSTALAILGNLWFAYATSLSHAHMARLMVGVGSAFMFVCSFKQAKIWLPDAYFPLAGGLTQVCGMIGAAFGSSWLTTLYPAGNWRLSVRWVSGVWALLWVVMLCTLRSKPNEEEAAPLGRLSDVMGGLYRVCVNRNAVLNGVYAGLIFLPTEVLGGWWGAYYLDHVHQLNAQSAGFLIGCIFLGWAIGGALIGYVAGRFGDLRRVMIFSALSSCVFLSLGLYGVGLSEAFLAGIFFAYGLSNSGLVLAYAISTDFVEASLSGSAVAFTNVMSIALGILMQPLVGLGLATMSAHMSMTDACRTVMLLLPLSLCAASYAAFRLSIPDKGV